MDTTPSSALPLSLAPSVPVAGCDTTAVDLSHVLTGLQRTGDLSSVLHDQPNLVGGIYSTLYNNNNNNNNNTQIAAIVLPPLTTHPQLWAELLTFKPKCTIT